MKNQSRGRVVLISCYVFLGFMVWGFPIFYEFDLPLLETFKPMENVALSCPIQFSASALEEVKRILNEDHPQHTCLRVGTKGGGCSGLTYVLEFDEVQERDLVYDVEGVQVVVNPAHLIYINGILVDWAKGLNARGFKFINPNASSTCGCGTSFSV